MAKKQQLSSTPEIFQETHIWSLSVGLTNFPSEPKHDKYLDLISSDVKAIYEMQKVIIITTKRVYLKPLKRIFNKTSISSSSNSLIFTHFFI